eukprot:2895836-Amphidinium_carterae.1
MACLVKQYRTTSCRCRAAVVVVVVAAVHVEHFRHQVCDRTRTPLPLMLTQFSWASANLGLDVVQLSRG